jgi:hypothetical protein
MVAEGPRHSHRQGLDGIVYARGAPNLTDCCGTRRSDMLGLRNPQCSWTSTTVGPSLPDFTIAPCVDSLLCYRSIRWPKSILQDSPEV